MDGVAVHIETGIYIQFLCNPLNNCFGVGWVFLFFPLCHVYFLYNCFELISYKEDIWEKIIKKN